MKKLFIIVAVAGLAISSSSCKKDYTCECTYGGFSSSTEIKDAKSSEAEETCDNLEAVHKAFHTDASCTLK